MFRAETYEAMGYIKLACDDYKLYRTLNPGFSVALENKAKDLEQFSDFMEANKIRNFIKKINSI